MQPETSEVGVLAEEFGHNFFGLPDLYTTDVDNSVGFWSIMAGGAWGGYLGGTCLRWACPVVPHDRLVRRWPL